MKYTTEQVELLAAKLREMPPIEKKKQEHGKQEVVKMLAKEIAAMQKRGYSLEQISDALRGNGFDITTPTLKSYLQRAKPAAKGKSKKGAANNKDTLPAPPPVTPPPVTPPPAIPSSPSPGSFTVRPDRERL